MCCSNADAKSKKMLQIYSCLQAKNPKFRIYVTVAYFPLMYYDLKKEVASRNCYLALLSIVLLRGPRKSGGVGICSEDGINF